jgi:hypothetical protein
MLILRVHFWEDMIKHCLWILLSGWSLPEHTGISDDLDVLVSALAPSPGMKWITLSSYGAGEAALTLAASGAETVIAGDLGDEQMLHRLITLKTCAASVLAYPEYLALMGLVPVTRPHRQACVKRTLGAMSGADQGFWSDRRRWLTTGLFFANRQTFFIFHFFLLICLLTPAHARRRMFFSTSEDERRQVFRRYVSRPALKYLFYRLGSHINFFYPDAEWRHSDYPRVYNRNPFPYFEHLVGTGLTGNPMFAHYFFNNNASPPKHLLPPHLRPQGYSGLRVSRKRIQVLPWSSNCLPLKRLEARSYHGAYLSNIIDYLGPDERHRLCRTLSQAMIPGAPVLIYSSESYSKVPPQCGLSPDPAASRWLASRDRVRSYVRVGLYRAVA